MAASAKKSRSKPALVLDQAELEAKALAYLDRFDASAAQLGRVLSAFVRRRCPDPARWQAPIDALVARYQASGLVDDRRYAETLAQSARARGASRRAILARLGSRGISQELGREVLDRLEQEGSGNAELVAARALVRRRRLGPYRRSGEPRTNFRRDLGVLARAGFDLDTARAALQLPDDPDAEEF